VERVLAVLEAGQRALPPAANSGMHDEA
jgi:hypothetical protein